MVDSFNLKARPGETIGGGFFVLRRASNGRLRTGHHCHPFEHAKRESALAEAERLAAKEGKRFVVLQQVADVSPSTTGKDI